MDNRIGPSSTGSHPAIPTSDADGVTAGQQVSAEQVNAEQVTGSPAMPEAYAEPEAPAVTEQRGAASGHMGELQMRELQMRQMMYGDATPAAAAYDAAPAGSFEAAEANLASNFAEVRHIGERIAEGTGPVSETDRQAWVDAQAKLRKSVTDLAASLASLPEDAPERVAAKAQLEQMSKQLAAEELPVLARLDPEFGKSWEFFHNTEKGSEGAVLNTRMKMYGVTKEELENYVATGEESAGLKRALRDAKNRGEWPALGVVRAAYQMRADYLRATTPENPESLKQAYQLDAAAKNLSQNRAAIHMNWGQERFAKLTNDHPDPAARTPKIQKQIDEAKGAVASVRQRAVDQVNANPDRYGKNSPTRKLAADSLSVEAQMTTTEAKISMNLDAQKAKSADPKITPPPVKLHPDLAEGAIVDQKRNEAVKIDPSIGDVVKGGDRAVRYVRDGHQLNRLRLNNEEQQIAHVASTGKEPAPDAVASVNRKLETIFKEELAIHEKLRSQKPGTLSVSQTTFLGELDNELAGDAAKISAVWNQKMQVEATDALARANVRSIDQRQVDLKTMTADFEKAKIERVRKDLRGKLPHSQLLLNQFEDDPKKYVQNPKTDNKDDAKFRERINDMAAQLRIDSADGKKMAAEAASVLAYSEKVNDLDGVNTDARMISGLAKDAIKESEAHFKAIPATGPERLARMEAALNHDAAAIGINSVIRNNSDARIERAKMSHEGVRLIHDSLPVVIGEDPIGNSAEYLRKTTAEETAIKKEAFTDAKATAANSNQLRKEIGKELDAAQAKLPKNLQQQNAGEVQQYKDGLALQQVQTQSVVAELGADLDPKESMAQLKLGNQIINEELPAVHPSRTDAKQARLDHTRNLTRGEALASVGGAATAIAERAPTIRGIPQGRLGADARAIAHQSAMQLKETLTIDSGGIQIPEFKGISDELKTRADGIIQKTEEIRKSSKALQLAEAIEASLPQDVKEFNEQVDQLRKIVDQREFGYLFRAGGYLSTGEDVQDAARQEGNLWIDQGVAVGRGDAERLQELAGMIRQMHAQGVPDDIILSTLRDPRLVVPDVRDPAQMAGLTSFDQDLAQISKDYGVTIPDRFSFVASRLMTDTPLGRAVGSMSSNKTDGLVSYVNHKYTDLLAGARPKLYEAFAHTQETWSKAAPIAALSQVADQVVFATASSAALAGVFARVANLTKIPQIFSAARGMATGLSTGGKIATLGAVNAAEVGLGMATGSLVSKIGTGIFGEKSTGAKIFDFVGSGLQLNVASKVALQKGLFFQAGLGFTMGSVPIVAEQLGMSPEMAKHLGTAVGVFVPTVLGTIGNHSTLNRTESVMINEFGLDPKKSRGLVIDVFNAESMAQKDFDVEGFTREKAAELIQKRFPDLGADAQAKVLDTMTLDDVRRRVRLDVVKSGTAEEKMAQVEAYYGRIESDMIARGVSPDRARELVLREKTAMFEDALATTKDLMENGIPTSSADSTHPNGAATATHNSIKQAAVGADQPLRDVQVLRTIKQDGVTRQEAESGYKLVYIDPHAKKATVVDADGKQIDVDMNDLVFVHDGQALGTLPAAMQRKFDERVAGLNEKQIEAWHDMIGEAARHNPEHVQLLRQLFATGSSLERVKGWHDWAMTVPHDVLGSYLSPGKLQQHLQEACAAACAQRIAALLHPQIGAALDDPHLQLRGQRNILEANQGGSAVRTDEHYDYRNAPPLGELRHFIEAKPTTEPRPAALDGTLTLAGDGDHSVYKPTDIDRRYLPQQLAAVADGGTAYLQTPGKQGKHGDVYEISNYRNQNGVPEVQVRKAGTDQVEYVPVNQLLTMDGNDNVLIKGNIVTDVAVPKDQPLKAADAGMSLARDPQIQEMVRLATGKGIAQRATGGEPALRAIYDSVKEVGFAGVSVQWRNPDGTPNPASHGLVVMGAKQKDGKFTFEVYDPTRGDTRTLSGEQLLRYNDGLSKDPNSGKLYEADLFAVTVPEDMRVGADPAKRGISENKARELITLDEPHKLLTLKQIDQFPDVDQRRMLTQLLSKERNPDRLVYLEDAVNRGSDAAADAAHNLMDPNFKPTPGPQHVVLSFLQSAKDDAAVKTVLSDQFPEFYYLDDAAQNSIANLFVTNTSREARSALFEAMPDLNKMPDEARQYAVERMSNMKPEEIVKSVAELRRIAPQIDWRNAGDKAMEVVVNAFGK